MLITSQTHTFCGSFQAFGRARDYDVKTEKKTNFSSSAASETGFVASFEQNIYHPRLSVGHRLNQWYIISQLWIRYFISWAILTFNLTPEPTEGSTRHNRHNPPSHTVQRGWSQKGIASAKVEIYKRHAVKIHSNEGEDRNLCSGYN